MIKYTITELIDNYVDKLLGNGDDATDIYWYLQNMICTEVITLEQKKHIEEICDNLVATWGADNRLEEKQ